MIIFIDGFDDYSVLSPRYGAAKVETEETLPGGESLKYPTKVADPCNAEDWKKSMSVYDAGFFYAPYIPLQKDLVDTSQFKPTTEFKTRYEDAPPIQDSPHWKVETIKTETKPPRTLNGTWTMEVVKDLRVMHGLDVEAELANILSVEIEEAIQDEINRSVVQAAFAESQKEEQQKAAPSTWFCFNLIKRENNEHHGSLVRRRQEEQEATPVHTVWS